MSAPHQRISHIILFLCALPLWLPIFDAIIISLLDCYSTAAQHIIECEKPLPPNTQIHTHSGSWTITHKTNRTWYIINFYSMTRDININFRIWIWMRRLWAVNFLRTQNVIFRNCRWKYSVYFSSQFYSYLNLHFSRHKSLLNGLKFATNWNKKVENGFNYLLCCFFGYYILSLN